MAREATRIAIELTSGGTRRIRRIELSTSMVIRESTAPPRQRPMAARV
jgi:DNA-binding LacI/PurR family transcriptional regulator